MNSSGVTGMIPQNYVRVLEPTVVCDDATTASTEPAARDQVANNEGYVESRRNISSRRLSLSAGALDDMELKAMVRLGASGNIETSIDPRGSVASSPACKSYDEVAAFDAELRRVADDDGVEALQSVPALREGAVECALAHSDTAALQAWLQALVDTPSLRALAIAFAHGGSVSGDAHLQNSDSDVENETLAAAPAPVERIVRAVALWDFSPSSESELALARGDFVEIEVESSSDDNADALIKREATDGWLRGTCERTGTVGYFPASYVSAADAPRAEPPQPASRESRPVSIRSLDAFDALSTSGIAVELQAASASSGPAVANGDLITLRCTASSWDGGAGRATPYASTDWDGHLVFVLGEPVGTDALHAGLKGLRRGDSVRLTCAPQLAYGAAGLPPHVAPGSYLIYEIDILDIVKGPASLNATKGPSDLLARPAAATTDEAHGQSLGRVVSMRKRITVQSIVGPENARTIPRKASGPATLPTHPETLDEK